MKFSIFILLLYIRVYILYLEEIKKLMIMINKIKNAVKELDMLGSTGSLHFQKSYAFHTFIGGIFSVAIIILAFASFTNLCFSSYGGSSISFREIIEKESIPKPALIKTNLGSKFMFGVRLTTLQGKMVDLNDDKRYFDIKFRETSAYGGEASYNETIFQKCTREHWKQFANILQEYDQRQIDNWLCPPTNFSFQLAGSLSFSTYKIASIDLTPCNNLTASQNICATAQETDSFLKNNTNLALTLYFTNPHLTLSQSSFQDIVLQNSKQSFFSSTLGSLTLLHLSDYAVETDNSIFLSTQLAVDKGILMSEDIIHRTFTKSASLPFARIALVKSSSSYVYERRTQKIFGIFAQIGGIFGIITVLYYMLKPYYRTHFQVSLSNEVFPEESATKDFHFYKYLSILFYKIFKGVGVCNNWQKGNKLIECQEQISEQLSLALLIRRILSLQSMVMTLFDDFQLQDQLSNGPTMEEAKIIRDKLANRRESKRSEQKKTVIFPEKSFPEFLDRDSKMRSQNILSDPSDQIIVNQKKLLENQFKLRLKAVTMLNKKIEPDSKLIHHESIRISPIIQPPHLLRLSQQIQDKKHLQVVRQSLNSFNPNIHIEDSRKKMEFNRRSK